MWLKAGAGAVILGGAGAAGGAAGGGGKELEAGEGFGATGTAFWFRFWFSFCAREVEEVAVLPPKAALGATAGALESG